MVDGYEIALLDGLTGYLQQVGALTGVDVSYGEVPSTPDVCVGVTLYGASDDVRQALSEYRCQFMFRGVPDDSMSASNVASAVFQALQGLNGLTLGGGVRLVDCQRRSFIPLPSDDNRRPLRSDNYVVTVNTPPTAFRE